MTTTNNLAPYTVKPGVKVDLRSIPSSIEGTGYKKKSAYKRIEENAVVMAELAKKLYAENKRSILLVLQGMDTAGKDGTIRSVMKGMNPTSCQVVSFKKPSEEDLDHDFLWRIHRTVPRRGNIGIFNRSHYEDVLIVRVHSLVPESTWQPRYELINDFEKLLSSTQTKIVKCFLHISKETQRERLQARLDDTAKHWKFNVGDLDERKRWEDYQVAYEACLENCSTEVAPWHIIPSDKKWCRNLVVSELLRATLEEMDPQFPAPEADYDGIVVE
ncbi:MAG: polyphosphate kinase 2 family protein [Mariniblastus sp.]|nr:polyphosphate kinase 2 family protein [Mariniblastus sp.]